MKRLIIGSPNQGKIREYERGLEGLPFEVVGAHTLITGFTPDEAEDNFLEIAQYKAYDYAKALHMSEDDLVLADYSGLCVTALDGAPGVYSARYADNENPSPEQNRLHLLYNLCDKPDRSAHFKCAVAIADCRKDIVLSVQAQVPGVITEWKRGDSTFGYDCLFEVGDTGKTFAELGEDKDKYSHRGKLMKMLRHILPLFAE